MLIAINVLLSVVIWLLFVKPDVLANLTTSPISVVLQVTTLGDVIALVVIFVVVSFAMLGVDKLADVIKRRKTLTRG